MWRKLKIVKVKKIKVKKIKNDNCGEKFGKSFFFQKIYRN